MPRASSAHGSCGRGRNASGVRHDASPRPLGIRAGRRLQLHAGGKNRVISYLDVGSCESFRSYWSTAPAPLKSCNANTAAKLGPYAGFPNEQWMNPANVDYQDLIVKHVAARLAATGVDGFFLD